MRCHAVREFESWDYIPLATVFEIREWFACCSSRVPNVVFISDSTDNYVSSILYTGIGITLKSP